MKMNTALKDEPMYEHVLIDADSGRVISEKHFFTLNEVYHKNNGFGLNNIRIKYVRVNKD